jgi:altronate hydrolase
VQGRVFKNVDGVKFLTHEWDVVVTRSDAQTLCGLLAGYITHPNVAGATVLSPWLPKCTGKHMQQKYKQRDPGF